MSVKCCWNVHYLRSHNFSAVHRERANQHDCALRKYFYCINSQRTRTRARTHTEAYTPTPTHTRVPWASTCGAGHPWRRTLWKSLSSTVLKKDIVNQCLECAEDKQIDGVFSYNKTPFRISRFCFDSEIAWTRPRALLQNQHKGVNSLSKYVTP